MKSSTRFVSKTLQIVLINCLIFVGYRLLFLWAFADPALASNAPAVLLYGLRLDIALLGRELLPLAILALVAPRLRYRWLLGAMWLLTYMNLAIVLVNFLFFRERNQHLWEMLLANLGHPSEILVALEPFLALHPLLPFVLLFLTATAATAALRHTRALSGHGLDVWRNPGAVAAIAGAGVLLFVPGLEPVPDEKVAGYTRYVTLASKHYMQFADYVLNQAVVNPFYDFFRYYGPSAFSETRYQLDAPEALQTGVTLLGITPNNDRYPLLRTVRSGAQLGIRNVILIQVEGLGASVVEHRLGDGFVMPHLHHLAEAGLSFPNIYQSFNATDGSVFATATSLHRTYAVSEHKSYFFPYEVYGLYGCPPRLFGPGYRHYFFAAFRQRIADFVTFMSNQGYESLGFEDFVRRLGDRAERESNMLGVFDGAMLQEAAKILVATPEPFTVHIMTGTSHSPWEVPASMPSRPEDPRLATFRYVDQSIRDFIERLRVELPDFDHTLFAIVGDHTSVTFTSSLSERVRVSLVLWSPELARQKARFADRQPTAGSHVDILPTILTLLDGEHAYGGMGRSLLDDGAVGSGTISSSHHDSLYIKDGFALHYVPHESSAELFALEHGEIVPRDVSAQHPEVTARLRHEYLALYETADRLTREKRVFPRGASKESRLLAVQ